MSNYKNEKIIIGQACDGFGIIITNGNTVNRYMFDQEDPVDEKLKKLFNDLGYENVELEEWY